MITNYVSLGCDEPRGGPVAFMQWVRFRIRMTLVVWARQHVSVMGWDSKNDETPDPKTGGLSA